MHEIQDMKHMVPTSFLDIPNWMLDDNGVLTQRVAKQFFSPSSPYCEWGKLA